MDFMLTVTQYKQSNIQKESAMRHNKKKQFDEQFKFVMVGDSAVGKSSLLIRFAENDFNENYMTTIGVDFRFKSVNVNNKVIKLQIWDTAGQQRFRTIINTYYKNSHAVYLVFDLGNPSSFEAIKSYWINEVESYMDQSAVLVLVGNKADTGKQVDQQAITSLCEDKEMLYFETSAKNSTNVQQIFTNVAAQVSQRRAQSGVSVDKQTHKFAIETGTQQQEKARSSRCSGC